MSQWRIDGCEKTFTCFNMARKKALEWARKVTDPAVLRYIGPKESPNNDMTRTDMLVYASKEFDPRIDPTWWSNQQRS